jgi:NAD(P)-dependent dehydrogenase (short-subunit alcohol dehydrogenase family)
MSQTVIATGASSGIGAATARRLAAAEWGDELDRVLHGRRTSA